jgi:shikimate dehydrogenase
VPDGATAEAVAAARTFGLGGLSVTMPHKAAAARVVDAITPDAAALGAVNCIVPHDGRLIGDNTDGQGLLASLVEEGFDVAGARAAVLGAGGAARAVVRSLAEAGVADVLVVGRNPSRAAEAAALAGDIGRSGLPMEVATTDLVVNATPVGMAGTPGAGEVPLDPALIGPEHLVVDLVYEPAETPLLAASRLRGAVVVGGLGMLVHQAALAFFRWTGVQAPIPVMRAAAEQALADRRPVAG